MKQQTFQNSGQLYLYSNKLIVKSIINLLIHRRGYYDVFSLPGFDRVDKFQVRTEGGEWFSNSRYDTKSQGKAGQWFSNTRRFLMFSDDPSCDAGKEDHRDCKTYGFRQIAFLYDLSQSAEENRSGGDSTVKEIKQSGNREYTCCQIGQPIFPLYNYVNNTFDHPHDLPALYEKTPYQYSAGSKRLIQYPAWSPGDRYLLFHVGYHGVKYPDGDSKSGEVYLVDLRNGLEQARYMKGTIAKHDLKGDRPGVGLAMKLGEVVEEENRVVVYNQDQSDSVVFHESFHPASEILEDEQKGGKK